ncbi:MAG TPA: FkbM family methyltransferase [Opitutaceae bacterium]
METSLKKQAVRVLAGLSPTALRYLAHRYPFERGRWPALSALLEDERGRAWLASLENPTRTRRGFEIYTLAGDLTSDWIKLHGQHEVATERFILDHLRPEGVFLDIGANIGYFALLAASTGSKSVAFEPQPQIAGLLLNSVAHNRLGHLIRVEQLALSDSVAIMGMTSCPGNTGHAQLAGLDCEGAQPLAVTVLPLDSWLDANPTGPVSVCKIDTEGAELQVLAGMPRLIERDRPAVVLECIDDFLSEFGGSGPKVSALFHDYGYEEVSKRYATHGDRNRYFVRRTPR